MTSAPLLTAAQAARRRCRTQQALCMERARGEGPPYIRDGNRILYPEDELEAWIAARRVDPSLAPKPRKAAKPRKATPKRRTDSAP